MIKLTKSIVLYFSATDTTKKRAEQVAQNLGADIFEIQAAQPYTAADLDWHDPKSRTSIEQHQHGSRVAIKENLPDISNYDNILVGFPIWWGIPPRLIADLIDRLPLNGKQLAGFATSGSSGFERAQSYLERTVKENNADVQVLPGAVLNSDAQMDAWLKQLNLN